ncbi:hypothetical protein KDL44_16350, partial [bacterium]|nr:hypothetical protein [bacterium]
CGKAPASLSGFLTNWTCPEFGGYVQQLRHGTDRLLRPEHELPALETLEQVIRFEHGFWDLGLSEDRWPG